jgi:hypothetical protein
MFINLPFIFGRPRWVVPEPNPLPELPEPSATLILLLAIVQAGMRTLPRKKRAAFLVDISDALGLQEAALNVLRFRPKSEDARVAAEMRKARAWWSQILGVLTRLGDV